MIWKARAIVQVHVWICTSFYHMSVSKLLQIWRFTKTLSPNLITVWAERFWSNKRPHTLFKSPQNPVTQPLCGARVDLKQKQENMNIWRLFKSTEILTKILAKSVQATPITISWLCALAAYLLSESLMTKKQMHEINVDQICQNKLASLKATPVRNYHRPSDPITHKGEA